MSLLPLENVTVIDLTRHRAGPFTSRLLGDWGATVIKVEEPTDKGDSMGGSRHGFDFQNLHRNKKSLTINLKKEEGQVVFKRLVKNADILLENFRPEVKFRLGADYETLKSINSRIICGSISGFGQSGPYSGRPAVDQIVQGMSGLMSVTGTNDSGPLRVGAAISDVSAGMALAHAVLLALFQREKTGEGQWVYTSLLESTLSVLDFQVARYLADGYVPVSAGNDHPTLMPTGLFKTADGQVNIAAAEDDKFKLLCKILDITNICDCPDYVDVTARSLNRKQLVQAIEQVTSTCTSNELIELLNEAGIPCGPVYNVGEIMSDKQLEHLDIKCSVKHHKLGDLSLLGQPIHLGGCTECSTIRFAAPEHGQHTRDILVDMLGFTEDEVKSLQEINVI